MRKIKGQKGLSLVEVTIMLLVLMLLTSVLAPSFWDFIHDAQWVKVKEDCEAIGISFTRLTRDIGPCVEKTAGLGCTNANRVDVMYSLGDAISVDLVTAPDQTWLHNEMTTTNWTVSGTNADTMENQFVTNVPGYGTPFTNYVGQGVPVGPLFGTGWRGAYLSPPIGPDPWGSKYLVNSGFNATSTDAGSANFEGNKKWWWEVDVICLTPGPNKKIETPFIAGDALRGTTRNADDYLTVISGSGK